jgi:hypothetical protein
MLKRAKRLFAWLLAPASLMTSHQALAEEVGRWKFNMVEGVTPVSQNIYGLHMQMFWWCVAIAVVVFGIMFYSMIMHRKSRGVKPANFHESTSLEIVWTAIPLLILIAMAIPATQSLIKLYDSSEAELDVAGLALGDRHVRLPALLVRDRELGLQGVRGGAGRGDSRDREHDPGQDDGALVGQDPACERRHHAGDGTGGRAGRKRPPGGFRGPP